MRNLEQRLFERSRYQAGPRAWRRVANDLKCRSLLLTALGEVSCAIVGSRQEAAQICLAQTHVGILVGARGRRLRSQSKRSRQIPNGGLVSATAQGVFTGDG